MTPADIDLIVKEIAGRWRECPPIKVLESIDDPDMPLFIRMAIYEYDELGAKGGVQGFVHEGTVYLVANTLEDEKAVGETLLHESVGHWGLSQVFGAEMKSVLDRVYENMPSLLIHNKADHYGFSIDRIDERRKIAEEYLCDMAQTGKKNSLLASAVAVIRSWIREHTVLLDDAPMTDAEIMRNYIEPARRFVEKGLKMPPEQRKALAGKTDEITSVAFKRVYHGSGGKFDSFEQEKLQNGFFGYGLYVTEREDYAKQYAVTMADFHLVNPSTGVARPAYQEENWVARYLFINNNEFQTVRNILAHPDYSAFTTANLFAHKKLTEWEESGLKSLPSLGQLYEVELPDNTVFLECDERLYNQPEIIKRAMPLIRAVGKGDELTGRDFYAELSQKLGGDRASSATLLEHGIDGLGYVEQAKTMTGGIGGRCFVLFDVARAVIRNVFNQGEPIHDGLDEPDQQPANRHEPVCPTN
jgi:hypothetical protein